MNIFFNIYIDGPYINLNEFPSLGFKLLSAKSTRYNEYDILVTAVFYLLLFMKICSKKSSFSD